MKVFTDPWRAAVRTGLAFAVVALVAGCTAVSGDNTPEDNPQIVTEWPDMVPASASHAEGHMCMATTKKPPADCFEKEDQICVSLHCTPDEAALCSNPAYRKCQDDARQTCMQDIVVPAPDPVCASSCRQRPQALQRCNKAGSTTLVTFSCSATTAKKYEDMGWNCTECLVNRLEGQYRQCHCPGQDSWEVFCEPKFSDVPPT